MSFLEAAKALRSSIKEFVVRKTSRMNPRQTFALAAIALVSVAAMVIVAIAVKLRREESGLPAPKVANESKDVHTDSSVPTTPRTESGPIQVDAKTIEQNVKNGHGNYLYNAGRDLNLFNSSEGTLNEGTRKRTQLDEYRNYEMKALGLVVLLQWTDSAVARKRVAQLKKELDDLRPQLIGVEGESDNSRFCKIADAAKLLVNGNYETSKILAMDAKKDCTNPIILFDASMIQAKASDMLGDLQGAMSCYQNAYKADPGNPRAWQAELGYARDLLNCIRDKKGQLRDAKKVAEARKWLNQTLKDFSNRTEEKEVPDSFFQSDIHSLLVEANRFLGRFDEAFEHASADAIRLAATTDNGWRYTLLFAECLTERAAIGYAIGKLDDSSYVVALAEAEKEYLVGRRTFKDNEAEFEPGLHEVMMRQAEQMLCNVKNDGLDYDFTTRIQRFADWLSAGSVTGGDPIRRRQMARDEYKVLLRMYDEGHAAPKYLASTKVHLGRTELMLGTVDAAEKSVNDGMKLIESLKAETISRETDSDYVVALGSVSEIYFTRQMPEKGLQEYENAMEFARVHLGKQSAEYKALHDNYANVQSHAHGKGSKRST